MNLHTVRNLSVLFLLSIALSLMGCGGGGSDGDTPDGDHDVLDQDLTADGDLDSLDNDLPSDTDKDAMVCYEDGTCCDGKQCCKNNHCWAQQPDVEQEGTDGEGEPDSDTPETTFCEETADCTNVLGQGYWCDKYQEHCRPNSELVLIEPYKALEGDYKCLEGGAFGEVFPLEILGWDDAELTAKASGIISDDFILTFKDAGGIMTLVSAIGQGSYKWLNPQYDNATHQISGDRYSDESGTTTHWVFQKQ